LESSVIGQFSLSDATDTGKKRIVGSANPTIPRRLQATKKVGTPIGIPTCIYTAWQEYLRHLPPPIIQIRFVSNSANHIIQISS
jgi:hypothetical protein